MGVRDPRAVGGAEYGMSSGIAGDPSQKRPHTAHGGRAPGQAPAAADMRKPGGPGSLEQDEVRVNLT